mgnify:CR=1 FL=1
MNSTILKMAVGVLKPLFLLVSLWLLLRGHNEPGGGFIGGLIAGSALILRPLAYDLERLSEKNKRQSRIVLRAGMILIFSSALLGLVSHNTLLKGLWLKVNLMGTQTLKVGTPLLFDMGIYLTVIGFIYFVFISMMEEWQWK